MVEKMAYIPFIRNLHHNLKFFIVNYGGYKKQVLILIRDHLISVQDSAREYSMKVWI